LGGARPALEATEGGEEFEVGGALRVRLARRLDEDAGGAPVGGSVPVAKALERVGDVPLPPYIRRSKGDPAAKEDAVRYQTIYARNPGSVRRRPRTSFRRGPPGGARDGGSRRRAV